MKHNKITISSATTSKIGLRGFLVLPVIVIFLLNGCGSSDQTETSNEPSDSRDSGAQFSIESSKLTQPLEPRNQQPHPPDPAAVADWKTYTYRTIKIKYPEGHPMEASLSTMASVMNFAQRRLAQFLAFPGALDSVTVYYYTGPGQATELIGTYYPFATDSTIHFTPPTTYGEPIAKWVLQKWQKHPTRHRFLREGLIRIFDLSGKDYFSITRQLFDSTGLSLADLATDTIIDADIDRDLAGAAGTFVDYVRYVGGPGAYQQLYHSEERFDKAVRSVLGIQMPVADLQWRQFVRNPPVVDTTDQDK